MPVRTPRIAVRAVIVADQHLLLVNAWPGGKSDLMCAPGGGAEPHTSLHENLIREVYEETGLGIDVGEICLVNEFHDPKRGFHQIDIFFRAHIVSGQTSDAWQDPEQIVTERRWVTKAELATTRVKPDALKTIAFGGAATYDPLELIQT